MLEKKLQIRVVSTISEGYIVNLGPVEIGGNSMLNGGQTRGTHYTTFSGKEYRDGSFNNTGIVTSAHKSRTASASSGCDDKLASAMAVGYFAVSSRWAY